MFQQLRSTGGKGLMPYITAGDPDLATTGRLLSVFDAAGCPVCELGFPFSDPIADGPVIQDSMTWALARHVRPKDILEMVQNHRAQWKMAVVAMLSYSIVHRLGPAAFIGQAAQAGMDGLIIPDLPIEEADALRGQARDAGLACSFLVAPGTAPARARQIAQASTGFVYVLARAGVTGERSEIPAELTQRLADLRQVTDLPLVVGFGVSTADQVRQVVAQADAAIVGSAIVRRIVDLRQQGAEVLVEQVRRLVVDLKGGLPG